MSKDDETPWHLQSYKEHYGAKRKRILTEVEEVLRTATKERDAKRDTKHFHPSELAKDNWCPRSTYYKITGEPESNQQRRTLRLLNIVTEGNAIHDKWQNWMWKAGGLWGWWRCKACTHRWEALSPNHCPSCSSEREYIEYKEVAIELPKYKMIGHADGVWIDDEGKAVVEIKSVGLGTLRWEAPKLYEAYAEGKLSLDELWKRIRRPLTSHRRQVNLYMHALGIHDAVVIYEWKPDQDVKSFEVKYSEELATPILDGITEVMNAIEDDFPPERHPDATSKSCDVCRFCPYRSTCWS